MTRLAAVRAFALFDLVVTGLLALPWVADRVLALLLTWFGLDGSPGDCSSAGTRRIMSSNPSG